jgi:hypothetical protein
MSLLPATPTVFEAMDRERRRPPVSSDVVGTREQGSSYSAGDEAVAQKDAATRMDSREEGGNIDR